MRVINGVTRWADDDWNTEGGRPLHFLLPTAREGACNDVPVAGTSRTVRKFNVKCGDVAAVDKPNYAAGRHPARAMACFEGSQRANVRPYRTLLRASFRLDLGDGPRTTADWMILAQYNAGPKAGDRSRNPPCALGLKTVQGQECLYFDVATLPYSSATEQGQHPAMPAPVPIDRSSLSVVLEFADGQGEEGLMRVRLDDELVCDYAGPTGYANHNGCYFAYGLYRSNWCPGGEDYAAAFENVVEGVAA